MIWKENTRYFAILPVDMLQEVLENILIDIIGYDKTKEWKLKDVARCVKYLKDNMVAIDIQISNPDYVDAFGVEDFIDTQMFDLAKYYFNGYEIISEEKYKELKSIHETIEY